VTCEIVKFALPVLLITIDCVAVVPMVTLPKFALVGLTLNCGTGAAAPVPVSDRFVGEFEAVLPSETFPLAAPVAVGAKFTMNDVEAPAARVSGSPNPDAL
jgi:hypothetical protein